MALSETLGQVMQTRPLLGYGAAYLGGLIFLMGAYILFQGIRSL